MTLIYDARDYGAVGDGTMDDTQAIQAAIDAAAKTGGQVYLSRGTYVVSGDTSQTSGPCLILPSSVSLVGDGAGDTSLKLADDWSKPVTGIVRAAMDAQDVGLADLTVDGNSASTSGRVDGFSTGAGPWDSGTNTGVTVSGVTFTNCSGNGLNAQQGTFALSVTDSVATGSGLDGFYAHLAGPAEGYVDAGGFQDNLSEGNGRNGFTLLLDNYRTTLADNDALENGSRGILVEGQPGEAFSERVVLTGGEIADNGAEGLLLKLTDFSRVSNVTVHDNGGAGIGLYGSSANTIAGNVLYNDASTFGNAEVVLQASDDSDVGAVDAVTGNVVYNNLIGGGNASYAVSERNEDITGFNTVFDNYFSRFGDPSTVFYGTDSNAFSNNDNLTVAGTAGNDVLAATEVSDTALYGFGGNDRLTGGLYDDVLYGGAGVDRLTGGAGSDTFRFTRASDSVRGANDLITDFVAGEDKLDLASLGYSGLGDGHNGTLQLSYNGSLGRHYLRSLDADSDGHYFQLALVGNVNEIQASDFETLVQGTSGRNTLTGSDNGETLRGLAGADTLSAGAGNDYVIGGAGADQLTGGDGNDVFVFDALRDSYANDTRGVDNSDTITDFRYDHDVLDLSAFRFTGLGTGYDHTLEATRTGGDMVLQSLEADANGNYFKLVLEGVSYINNAAIRFGAATTTHFNAEPTSYDDYYIDEPTANDDTLVGYYTNDRLNGLAGNDTLRGEAGDDRLDGGAGSDTLDGGNGNDQVAGGRGSDILTGGSGDDVLTGGAGLDQLTGGSGDDTFRFLATTDSLRGMSDVITDFDASHDLLDVAALGYTGLGSGRDGTLKVSYSAAADRTYVKDFTAGADGERFEITLDGDLSHALSADAFVFAPAPEQELALLGVAA
ncbi:M10 family metallopeptidase C-terminal domain-containing protein [Pseudomonas japonica]|uniref:M10 family metallopeptidase C-terminal domain-containing protein n=1 Tax=Pseudomonas japonica TaxID=256466 RepID=UPI0015E2EF2B|nr:glycosyl hydrolase family 28-related protein [Pseudomonas japonica]MBA1245220.1 hypothetical protein [Pseudomonas japonica]